MPVKKKAESSVSKKKSAAREVGLPVEPVVEEVEEVRAVKVAKKAAAKKVVAKKVAAKKVAAKVEKVEEEVSDVEGVVEVEPAVKAGKTMKRKRAGGVSPDSGVFEGEALAREAARFADDKKAENIMVLDVRGLSPVTDFLVICEGAALPHLRAIQSDVAGRMRQEHGQKAYSSHGTPDSGWMLIDFGDVVVHIFHAEKRAFYGIEDMWNDAPRIL
ncbi:MAG: Ribosomal silencing factor RsfS [Verrucomicrobia bacterium]|jgi:ribosome-associated protein|nr:MAG: Ribosomal silencing factor RsfS [Verrucomicrobiota bacterium]